MNKISIICCTLLLALVLLVWLQNEQKGQPWTRQGKSHHEEDCPPPKIQNSTTIVFQNITTVVIQEKEVIHEKIIVQEKEVIKEVFKERNETTKTYGEDIQNALNLLDPSRRYRHSPIVERIPKKLYPVRDDIIVEPTGLLVPSYFDCFDLFNPKNNQRLGTWTYFKIMPSRFHRCYYWKYLLDSQILEEYPPLPSIDEEYEETIAAWQVAMPEYRLAEQDEFVVIEMGARWGPWGTRALSMLRLTQPHRKYAALYFEMEQLSCAALEEIHKLNKFVNYTVVCSPADKTFTEKWAEPFKYIDLLDIDIQGAEVTLVPQLLPWILKKVKRIVLGTHFPNDLSIVEGWFPSNVWKRLASTPAQGTNKDMENRPIPITALQSRALKSPYGPIVSGDGEFILENLALVSQAFEL
jgi:hypothetical protein